MLESIVDFDSSLTYLIIKAAFSRLESIVDFDSSLTSNFLIFLFLSLRVLLILILLLLVNVC